MQIQKTLQFEYLTYAQCTLHKGMQLILTAKTSTVLSIVDAYEKRKKNSSIHILFRFRYSQYLEVLPRNVKFKCAYDSSA